jgi:PAS domain S-box-containing protein
MSPIFRPDNGRLPIISQERPRQQRIKDMDIPLSSAGSLCVAVLAFFFFLCQAWLFIQKTELTWNAWGAGLSFFTAVYSLFGFVQYNAAPNLLNHTCELIQYTCMIGLIHCASGFTFSFLAIRSRGYHRIAFPLHAILLLVLWLTPLFVGRDFVYRQFLWLNRPFIEPHQGPLGLLLLLYIAAGSLFFIYFWIRYARTRDAIPFFIGFTFWAILGIHDTLATLGMPTIQFLMQYGFLGFAASILSLTAKTYVEVYNEARSHALQARRERDRLDATIRSMADGFFALDQQGRISLINETAGRIFGRDPEASTGLPAATLFEAVDPQDRRILENLVPDVLGKGAAGTSPERFSIHGPKGEAIQVSETHAPIHDEGGEIVGAVFVFRDITDLREMEIKLNHAAKMEAIGTLAGGVAHDFNNLLMGIQGYASLMLMDLDPSHPHYEGLRCIEEQVKSAADLTRQLLGFARGGRYQVKPANLNHIIEGTSALFGRTHKEIIIYRMLQKDLWTVKVDQGQIEQVLMNIYLNALQAMPGGGELSLETRNVVLDEKEARSHTVRQGQYVKVSITDTGTGMDEKTLARIFDPFFTTKKMGRGTGLGLAMVYGIIRGHEGLIDVTSQVGHGSTFAIYLPAAEIPALTVDEKRAADIVLKGTETVLLVDDEQMILKVGQGLLESLGYRVYVASSGQATVAIYLEKKGQIDLVILDMIMPGISGGETYDRLREIDPGVKVLLASGYSIEGEAQQILDRGCRGFIQKPFQTGSLSRMIREVLDAEPHPR